MDTEAVIEAADVVDGRPPGADRKEQIIRMVALFVMPFLMVTMMFATYMSTMHSPRPRDMPVAVVGQRTATAQALVDGLPAGRSPEAALVPPVDDASTCSHDQRGLRRARSCPPSGRRQRHHPHRLGGRSLPDAHRPAVPRARGRPRTSWQTTTEDVAPLPAGDSAGTAVLFAAHGHDAGRLRAARACMAMALPHLLRLRRFLPVLAGWSAADQLDRLAHPRARSWAPSTATTCTFLGVGMLATVGAVGLAQLLLHQARRAPRRAARHAALGRVRHARVEPGPVRPQHARASSSSCMACCRCPAPVRRCARSCTSTATARAAT